MGCSSNHCLQQSLILHILYVDKNVLYIIIQQIVTMPVYGKEALNICHPYMTDILRYT